jgi:hypothetical protein
MLHIIDQDLVGQLLVKHCCKVDVFASVVMESIGSEIGDPEVDVGSVSAFDAVNLVGERDSNASAEVRGVVVVLSVEVEVGLVE